MKITGPDEAAFPRPCGAANRDEQSLEQDGVTCLEWYAAKAMQSLIAVGMHEGNEWKDVARQAFDAADAMAAEARRRRDEAAAKFRREYPDDEE